MNELQSWWEVPAIAYFCHVFKSAFNLFHFEIEELEAAFYPKICEGDLTMAPSASIEQLFVRLLEGVCPKSQKPNAENWLEVLRKKFQMSDRVDELPLEFLTAPFADWKLRTKVEVLLCLCELRLDNADIIDQLVDANAMRIDPVGMDSSENVYWYFFGMRLYKEVPNSEKKSPREKPIKKGKTRGRKRNNKGNKKYNGAHETENGEENGPLATNWQLVCQTREDWESLILSLRNSGLTKDKKLAGIIENRIFPVVLEEAAKKDLMMKKKLLEILPRRTSARIDKVKQEKEKERAAAEQERLRRMEEEHRRRMIEEEERKKQEKEMRAKRAAERERAIEERAERARLRELRLLDSDHSDSSQSASGKKRRRINNGYNDEDSNSIDDGKNLSDSLEEESNEGDQNNHREVKQQNEGRPADFDSSSSESSSSEEDDDDDEEYVVKTPKKTIVSSSKPVPQTASNMTKPRNAPRSRVKPVQLTSVLLKPGVTKSSTYLSRPVQPRPFARTSNVSQSQGVSNSIARPAAITYGISSLPASMDSILKPTSVSLTAGRPVPNATSTSLSNSTAKPISFSIIASEPALVTSSPVGVVPVTNLAPVVNNISRPPATTPRQTVMMSATPILTALMNASRPSTVTTGRPSTVSMSRPSAVTTCRPSAVTSCRSSAVTSRPSAITTCRPSVVTGAAPRIPSITNSVTRLTATSVITKPSALINITYRPIAAANVTSRSSPVGNAASKFSNAVNATSSASPVVGTVLRPPTVMHPAAKSVPLIKPAINASMEKMATKPISGINTAVRPVTVTSPPVNNFAVVNENVMNSVQRTMGTASVIFSPGTSNSVSPQSAYMAISPSNVVLQQNSVLKVQQSPIISKNVRAIRPASRMSNGEKNLPTAMITYHSRFPHPPQPQLQNQIPLVSPNSTSIKLNSQKVLLRPTVIFTSTTSPGTPNSTPKTT